MGLLLTTTSRVTTLLGIGTGTLAALESAALDNLIASVSDTIERFLDRHTTTSARTEFYACDAGSKSVQLRGFPVTTVSTVLHSAEGDFVDGMETLTADEYQLDAESGILFFRQTRDPGPLAWKITYTGGLAADTTALIAAYPTLADACEKQVTHEWRRRLALAPQSSDQGGSSVNYTGAVDLLPVVQRILTPYRRITWMA
jgi:hypothetical protein